MACFWEKYLHIVFTNIDSILQVTIKKIDNRQNNRNHAGRSPKNATEKSLLIRQRQDPAKDKIENRKSMTISGLCDLYWEQERRQKNFRL